jgi:hypothetical protein
VLRNVSGMNLLPLAKYDRTKAGMSNFGGMRTWTGEQNLLSSCTRLVCLSRWRMYLSWSMLKSSFQKLFFLVRRFRPRLTDSQERRGSGVCMRVCFCPFPCFLLPFSLPLPFP